MTARKITNMAIDPIQFGKMIAMLEQQAEDLKKLSDKLDNVQNEVQSLIDTKNKGAGILLGVTLASGSAGAILTKLVEHLK